MQTAKKILVATDGEPHSNVPVTCAAELATRLNATLAVIAVNVLLYNARGGSSHVWTDERLTEILEAAREAAKAAGCETVELVRAVGTYPSSTILDYAEENSVDHIVVGSPRVGVARLFLGSVASEVVAKAHCPVTVAR